MNALHSHGTCEFFNGLRYFCKIFDFEEFSVIQIFLEGYTPTDSDQIGDGTDTGLSFTYMFSWNFLSALVLLVKIMPAIFIHSSGQDSIQKLF